MKKDLTQNLPYQLLRLGLKCNAYCTFCNVPPESFSFTQEISTAQAKEEISRLISEKGEIKLSLSGGEPTLRKDLGELIAYAHQEGVKTIEIQTNAILLADKGYVKKLKRAGLDKAFVAFHAHIPTIHDDLVGQKGAFKRCYQGIKNLLAEKIEVILNPVITINNFKYLPDYIEFVYRKMPGIKCISLSVIQPRGRAWENRYLVPRYKILDPYVRKALQLGKKFGIVINNPYCGLPFCIGGWDRHLEQCVEYCENRLKKAKDRIPLNSKIKPRQCKMCRFNSFCNGVWQEYALLYPLSDLRPLKKHK
jgi:MoaA/NifB/PqqE/SkfB family radical SAM enzyme